MKKLVTFLFCVGAVATSFAQYNQRSGTGRDDQYAWKNSQGVYDRNDHRFNDGYFFTAQERDFQIAKINREFDYKLTSIRNDRFLKRREMKRMIKEAEFERDQQIRTVYAKFSSSKNQFNGYKDGRHDDRRH